MRSHTVLFLALYISLMASSTCFLPYAAATENAIPFEVFARFERVEQGNPIFAGKPPEWAAAAHAIVVDDTVHYLWALRQVQDHRWLLMHSQAPVSDPAAVKHDPRNPILSPSADGFDNIATEYLNFCIGPQ